MTKPITSLSIDDVRWVHQAAVSDTERAAALYPGLTQGELETWRIICTIAALNAMSMVSDRKEQQQKSWLEKLIP